MEDDNVPHCRALRFAHFTEMCILIVQLVVEFTKQLPGFLRVLREDQVIRTYEVFCLILWINVNNSTIILSTSSLVPRYLELYPTRWLKLSSRSC